MAELTDVQRNILHNILTTISESDEIIIDGMLERPAIDSLLIKRLSEMPEDARIAKIQQIDKLIYVQYRKYIQVCDEHTSAYVHALLNKIFETEPEVIANAKGCVTVLLFCLIAGISIFLVV